MPEYRRFIAYFYEYIDGKKQKNAGFAKVELRNDMWRILFRLMTDRKPEGPLQVYGFVREQGYLLGFPLGMIQGGREIGEEWAYQANALIGYEKYRFDDLSGIWMKSPDEREFITVWDDEGLDTKQFVLKMPQESPVTAENLQEQKKEEAGQMKEVQETGAGQLEEVQETGAGQLEEPQEAGTGQLEELQERKAGQIGEPQEAGAGQTGEQEQMIQAAEMVRRWPDTVVEEILQKRKPFRPFQDEKIEDCVQIMPCDIVRLQQGAWNVGRSSFLQHGFYQYRHLLLGKQKDGTYILGVPGEYTPQEQYLAVMFGYDRFQSSGRCSYGKKYGYWYRTLTRQP